MKLKLYFSVVAFIIYFGSLIGGALPLLISEDDTIVVWIGVIGGLLNVPLGALWIIKIYDMAIKVIEELENA